MTATASKADEAAKDVQAVEHTVREKRALAVLLIVSASIYTWSLDQNGWGNAYYAGAVQAGQHDLRSFFFGAADWGNSITVDKPPLSLWIMGLSVRMFGLNAWAMLLPQVIMTLASTLLAYKIVKLAFPAPAALLSAGVFAVTPITVLMARYNNPDPLMVLLMLAGVYAGIRGSLSGKSHLICLASIFIALGFLAKQLQAFLVVPAIVLAFIVYSDMPWRKRLGSLAAAGVLLVAGSLSWPLFVDFTPAEARPYVGGSRTNSMLELTLGYNGLERVIQGEEAPSTALIPEELRSVATDAGLFRLFNANYGQEIGWLLLPAMVASVAMLVRLLRGGYNKKQAVIVCASITWFLTTFLVLSFMGNNFHSYYTASLAAPLALCFGMGVHMVWTTGGSATSRILAATLTIASFIFSRAVWQLSDAYPELLATVLFLMGLVAAAVMCVPAPMASMKPVSIGIAVAALLVGPILSSILTVMSPQEGSNPLSGGLTRNPNTLSHFLDRVKRQDPAWATGIALGAAPSPALVEVLQRASDECTWAAATYPGQTAARLQLEIGRPVMALGGFAGTDPTPTSQQFQEWVSSGKVCFLIEQPEQLAVPGNSEYLISIQKWVSTNFEAEIIDGITVYRLAS